MVNISTTLNTKNILTTSVELLGAPRVFTTKLGVSISFVAYRLWNSRCPDLTEIHLIMNNIGGPNNE